MTGRRLQSALTGNATHRRLLTIPNALCAIRLIGALGLIPLALAEKPVWVLAAYFVLTATDWIDGKLAVWLDQCSAFGARLDSAADVTLYAMLLFAGVWLRGDVLLEEWPWIAAAVLTYAVSCLAAWLKFRRLPSYHTRAAKTAWLLMVAAVVSMFLDWSPWPLRVAMLVVALGNIEAVVITKLLDQWRADVASLRQALRISKSRQR